MDISLLGRAPSQITVAKLFRFTCDAHVDSASVCPHPDAVDSSLVGLFSFSRHKSAI